jgi:Dehydratase family/D-isomer specific 2-hydroxyacid dehydrogenase, NAD binding domain
VSPDAGGLRSQRLRRVNHHGDALRLGMNWTEEDLTKPQVLVESAHGMDHPGTFHFGPLIEEVCNGVFEAGGKPAAFTVSDICDGVVQATDGMSYSLVSRDIMASDAALYPALQEGWIAGAGLDDIEEEPAKQREWRPTNPLFGLDNVIITPTPPTTPRRPCAPSASSPLRKWCGCSAGSRLGRRSTPSDAS